MSIIKLDEMTYPKVRDLLESGVDTVIFPVGTLEAHGLHSPIGTDNFCAENISWVLSEYFGWPVAPTLNYGITNSLIGYPGSIRIERDLYNDLISNILVDFFQMGFRRVIIMNGHGGNTEELTKVAKDLVYDDRGNRHIIVVDWWQLDHEALQDVYGRPGGHAALDETAMLLAFRPDTIEPGACEKSHESRNVPGVVSLPCPAAMLVYEEGDASPDFDSKKAKLFMEKVVEKIETIIKRDVELFDKTFGWGED